MDYTIRKVLTGDKFDVIDILNHFIENSFAAYPDKKVGYEFFEKLYAMAYGYPFYVAEDQGKRMVGFGFIRPYHLFETFRRAAELAYFILPEHTRKGLGNMILNILIKDATAMGIDTLLANISSLNESSLAFHEKNGFTESGRLKRVGKKFGKDFDVVWMQRFI